MLLPNHNNNPSATYTSWDNGVQFVIKQVHRLLKMSGTTTPPFLPERLAHFQGVKRIVKEDLGDVSGLLLPLHDGFEIKINATHPPKRQNFSCAHELAHTFFFEEEGRTVIERLKRENGKKAMNNWEESLCDIAASELLMPSQIFIRYASRHNFNICSTIPLSQIFNTSIIPTVLRLCDLNPRWCFLVHWARENSGELDDLKLRATWLTWSRKRISGKMGRFLFKPKVFCKSPSISKAYLSDSPTYSNEWMGVGSFRGNCRIWSQGFDSGSYRFVISLIFPECDG